jgi:hypothetical protein
MDLEHVALKDNVDYLKDKVQSFMSFLCLENVLIYPELQESMDFLVQSYLMETMDHEQRKMFFNELLQHLYDQVCLTKEQLYVLKVASSSDAQDSLLNLVIDKFPSGSAFQFYIEKAYKEKCLLSAYTVLQIAKQDMNNDEFSRKKVKDTLYAMLMEKMFSGSLPDYEKLGSNDVFYTIT